MAPVDPTEARFATTLSATGGNNVAVVVPDDVVRSFGRGQRVPVAVTVNDSYTYRSTISPMGGRSLISFNAATRSATGLAAGAEVLIRLVVDDQPRTVDVPEVLAAALASDAEAAAAWVRLSYSVQRRHADSITGAKTEATRERRLGAVLAALQPPSSSRSAAGSPS